MQVGTTNKEFDNVRKHKLVQLYQDELVLTGKHRKFEELDIICMQRGDDKIGGVTKQVSGRVQLHQDDLS